MLRWEYFSSISSSLYPTLFRLVTQNDHRNNLRISSIHWWRSAATAAILFLTWRRWCFLKLFLAALPLRNKCWLVSIAAPQCVLRTGTVNNGQRQSRNRGDSDRSQNRRGKKRKIKNANEKYRGSLYNSVHTWPFVFLIRKVSLLSHREGNPPTK